MGADYMRPQDSGHWRELGVQLRQQGRFAEAVDACRRALESAPGDALAWNELAHALRLQGQLAEARSAAERALQLDPGLARAWFNLGAVATAQGEPARGIESYRKALGLNPEFAEAWSNLGGVLGAQGRGKEEIDSYRRALAINPQLAPVWSNLGEALRTAGELDEAAAACRRAAALDPGFAAAWHNLGNVLFDAGKHEESRQACEQALQLAPRFAAAWSTLGNALQGLGRLDGALRAHHQALEIDPGSAELHFNLGVALKYCGRITEAVACYRRGLALDPGNAEAHWNLGLALLTAGELREGWDEYEWRWRRRKAEAKRYDFAAWNGDVSQPSRLLVWAEQGIGDEIIYASMLADLAASPLRISLEADPRLVSLFQRALPHIAVIPRSDPPAIDRVDYDFEVPLASLGRWLRPSFASFPRHEIFLRPDPPQVAAYRRRLRELAPGATKIIGVSWRSKNVEFGSFKSLQLLDWAELLRDPQACYVDLQYGDTTAERGMLAAQTGLRLEHLPELDLFNDIEGLAAVCAACDLVITVSNVTTHIAGALGRPVWQLTAKAKGRIWYWFSDRHDSPWYPSLRLFTQQTPGSWVEVMADVARELAAFVRRKA